MEPELNEENAMEEEKQDVNYSTRHGLIIEIDPGMIEKVKESCIKRNFPLIQEYDFKRDKSSCDLNIELKSSTQIRPY